MSKALPVVLFAFAMIVPSFARAASIRAKLSGSSSGRTVRFTIPVDRLKRGSATNPISVRYRLDGGDVRKIWVAGSPAATRAARVRFSVPAGTARVSIVR